VNVFGIGPVELIVIGALALVVFGPEQLVEVARKAGQSVAQMRKVKDELTGDLKRSLQLDTDPPPRPGGPPGTAAPGTPPPFQPATPPPSGAAPAVRDATSEDLRPPY
jgi:Sec-independent protein translocase protein TatA